MRDDLKKLLEDYKADVDRHNEKMRAGGDMPNVAFSLEGLGAWLGIDFTVKLKTVLPPDIPEHQDEPLPNAGTEFEVKTADEESVGEAAEKSEEKPDESAEPTV